MSDVGFLLNLSFPSESRHVSALHDVIVQAVRQAGGDEAPARRLAQRAAALLQDSADGQPGAMTMVVHLGPPIQVTIGGRTLTLDNPAEAGRHDPQ